MGLCPLSLPNHRSSEGGSKLGRVLQRLIIASYAFWNTKIQLGFPGSTDVYKTDIPLRWLTALAVMSAEATGPVTNLRTEGTNYANLRGRLHSRPCA